MFGCLRSVVGKLVMVVLLVLAAYAGWQWGPQVFPRVHRWLGLAEPSPSTENVSSPALADSVLARIQAFRGGEDGEHLALGGRDLTSVLRYSVPGMIPEGVTGPEVRLADGRVHLRARVALSSFPDLPDLGLVLGILPDTLDVALEASLMPFGEGRAALLVHEVQASKIPLPRRLIPEILDAMGREDQPGLPPEAILVPLPSGLGTAYILTDSLILSNGP